MRSERGRGEVLRRGGGETLHHEAFAVGGGGVFGVEVEGAGVQVTGMMAGAVFLVAAVVAPAPAPAPAAGLRGSFGGGFRMRAHAHVQLCLFGHGGFARRRAGGEQGALALRAAGFDVHVEGTRGGRGPGDAAGGADGADGGAGEVRGVVGDDGRVSVGGPGEVVELGGGVDAGGRAFGGHVVVGAAGRGRAGRFRSVEDRGWGGEAVEAGVLAVAEAVAGASAGGMFEFPRAGT